MISALSLFSAFPILSQYVILKRVPLITQKNGTFSFYLVLFFLTLECANLFYVKI